MKFFILFFILFFSTSLFSTEYKTSLGIKATLPIELTILEGTAKSIGVNGDIDYKWGIGAVLDNDFRITDFITLSLALSYQYTALSIFESQQENPEEVNSPYDLKYNYDEFHLIKITPRIKLFFLPNLYSGIGLSYDYYINKPNELEINKLIVALNLSVGYLINNFGVEFSIEGLKDFDITVKTKAYLDTALTVFYLF